MTLCARQLCRAEQSTRLKCLDDGAVVPHVPQRFIAPEVFRRPRVFLGSAAKALLPAEITRSQRYQSAPRSACVGVGLNQTAWIRLSCCLRVEPPAYASTARRHRSAIWR